MTTLRKMHENILRQKLAAFALMNHTKFAKLVWWRVR